MELLIKMYLYQNTENSQNKHQILNRIVKSIESKLSIVMLITISESLLKNKTSY